MDEVGALVIALIGLPLISGCLADELIVLGSATAGHDERTGKLILELIFTEASGGAANLVTCE